MPDLGTARGVVRVDYQTSGADKVQKDTQNVIKYTDQARKSMDGYAKAVYTTDDSLSQYMAKSKAVGVANEALIASQKRLTAATTAGNLSGSAIRQLENDVVATTAALNTANKTYEIWLNAVNKNTGKLTFDGRQFSAGATTALSGVSKSFADWGNRTHTQMSAMGTRWGDALGAGMAASAVKGTANVSGAIVQGLASGARRMTAVGANLGGALVAGLRGQANQAGGAGKTLGASIAGGFGGALRGVASGVGGAAAIAGIGTAAVGATVAVAALGASLKMGFSRLEQIDQAKTKLAALGLSAKEIASVADSALKAVEGTAFGLQESFQVAAAAINAGVKPGKQLDEYLSATASTAALAGTSMERIGDIFNKVATSGKLDGREMQQLYYAQVPVLKLIGDQMGVTQAKARQMVSEGKVDLETFTAAMNRNAGAAKAMGNTLDGSMKNLRASLSRLGASLLAPLFGKQNASDANVLATAVQKVTGALNAMGGFFKGHSSEIITFWEVLGKSALVAGKAVTTIVRVVATGVVDLIESLGDGAGWIAQFGSTVAGVLGAHGVQKDLDNFAKGAHKFGTGLRQNMERNLGGVDRAFDNGWKGLESWADKSRKAGEAAGDLNDKMDPKPAQTVSEALDELNVSTDTVSAGIKGTADEFNKMLDALRKKGASDALVSTIRAMREEYQKSGKAADELAKAIDDVNDSSKDAASSSAALVKALRDIGDLAGNAESALSKYNETVDEIYDPSKKFVDLLDRTGPSLIDASGALDQTSKNGRALFEETDKLVKSMAELMASGADVDSTYENTSQNFKALAAQFGITGDAADKLFTRYFGTKQTWEVTMSVKGQNEVQKALASLTTQLDAAKQKGSSDLDFRVNIDKDNAPALKKAVEQYGGIWKGYNDITGQADIDLANANIDELRKFIKDTTSKDPAKLQTEMDLKTTRDDLVDQVAPNGNPLKIPTVLDVQGATGPDGKPVAIPGQPGGGQPGGETAPIPAPQPIPQGPANRAGPQLPNGTQQPYSQKDINPTPVPVPGGQSQIGPFPVPGGPGAPTGVPGVTGNSQAIQNAIDQAMLLGQVSQGTLDTLHQVATNAQAQGQSLSEAFAQGIKDNNEEVKNALLELAQFAPDILGNSPAKYGPLSGSGWTYSRGGNFTKDFARGISSAKGDVQTSTLGLADAATSPLEKRMNSRIKDLQQLSDIGKSLNDFAQSVVGIVGNIVGIFTKGQKTYVKDPNAKAPSTGHGVNASVFSGSAQRGVTNMGNAGAGVAPSGVGAGQQGVADYIIQKAMAQGYSRQQANWFATQAFGESGFRADANGGNQDGTGAVGGIFQFTPGTWGNRPGSMWNAKDNIDQYFALAQERGLTPENFADPTQLGTQVSIGGPYHPQNAAKGHRANAEAGVQPFLDAFAPDSTVPQPNPTSGGVPTPSQMSGNVSQWGNRSDPNGYPGGVWNPTPYGLPGGTDTGGYGSSGPQFPQWVHDLEARFGVKASTYPGHQESERAGKEPQGYAPNPQGLNRGIDWTGSTEAMQAFAEYLQSIAPGTPGLEQIIWQNPNTMGKIGLGGRGNPTTGYYPDTGDGSYQEHQGHVHSRQSTSLPLPGQIPGTNVDYTPSNPLPVSLDPTSQGALTGMNTSLSHLPYQFGQVLANDPETMRAYNAAKGIGGAVSDADARGMLSYLDRQIANQPNTPQGKAMADQLGQIRTGIMGNNQLTEGQDQASMITDTFSSAAGLVSDGFKIFDDVLQSIQSTQNIVGTLNRGIANTDDVMKIIDNVQTFIQLGADISKTVSDGLGLASKIAGAAGSGDPSGGASGAAAALGIASTISSVISEAYQAVNTVIDISQEVYKMAMKYSTRNLLSWMGFDGATDMNYLLETRTGVLKAYTSENPNDKRDFNTLGNLLTGNNAVADRSPVVNSFTIYQGPGQDPRDTMNDSMFMIRSAGSGVFGYA